MSSTTSLSYTKTSSDIFNASSNLSKRRRNSSTTSSCRREQQQQSETMVDSSVWNVMYKICVICFMEAVKLLRGLEQSQQQQQRQQQHRMLQMEKQQSQQQRSSLVYGQQQQHQYNERTFVSVSRTTIKLNPSIVKSVRSMRNGGHLVTAANTTRNGISSSGQQLNSLKSVPSSTPKPKIHFNIKSVKCQQSVLRRLPSVYRSRRRRSQPFASKLAVIREESWSDLD